MEIMNPFRVGLAWIVIVVGGCQSTSPSGDADSLPPADRPNFVVFDIDSMRADLLHQTHQDKPIAPTLAALAEDSVQFENMFSQSSWTLPSLTSFLTGRYPPSFSSSNPRRAQIRSIGDGFPEVLRKYGYQTAVAWGDTVAVQFPALSEGFDVRISSAVSPSMDFYQKPVVEYLRAGAEEPFFLLVHNMDLHRPVPPPPASVVGQYSTADPLPRCTSLNETHKGSSKTQGEEAARQQTKACYQATLAAYDQVVQAVLEALGQVEGRVQRTVVMLVSNHGEEFFEHGKLGHAELQYDTVLRVPLFISDPRSTGPKTVSEVVQTIDLAPTILARAGATAPHDLVGGSLLPLMGLAEGAYQERDVFSFANVATATLRTERHKLHLAGRGAGLETQLFDIQADPGEQTDVSAALPDVAAEMTERLQRFIGERRKQGDASPRGPGPEHLERALKERGYWEMVKEPKEEPKDP